jgi:hypothetical protein
MDIQKVSARHVSAEIFASMQNFDLASLQRDYFDVCVFLPDIRRGGREKNGSATRQDLRPPVRVLASGEVGQILWSSSRSGYTQQRS